MNFRKGQGDVYSLKKRARIIEIKKMRMRYVQDKPACVMETHNKWVWCTASTTNKKHSSHHQSLGIIFLFFLIKTPLGGFNN